MVDVGRARRLSRRIGTIVASVIEFEIKDPPLAFVTITDTKVTGDLHDATVYYTVRGETLQDEPDYAGAAAALERAKGTLRTRVGAATGVRFTPTLSFVLDKVPDTAAHMEELLARARAADEDLARVRQGAKHAGDADPYRQDDRVVGVPPAGEASGGGPGGELDDEQDAEETVDRD
jgi:ribosome-binding factor A